MKRFFLGLGADRSRKEKTSVLESVTVPFRPWQHSVIQATWTLSNGENAGPQALSQSNRIKTTS
jgi:hypothetical protein